MSDDLAYKVDQSYSDGGSSRAGGKYHWPDFEGSAMSRCGRIIIDFGGRTREDVPSGRRCMHPACAPGWGGAK